MRRLLLLAPVLALAACATPSQRIAAKLTEYGVPQREAQCMGDKLASRLSISQLKRLNEIGRLNSDRIGRMSITEIARQFSSPGDAVIGAEVLRAGVGCAL